MYTYIIQPQRMIKTKNETWHDLYYIVERGSRHFKTSFYEQYMLFYSCVPTHMICLCPCTRIIMSYIIVHMYNMHTTSTYIGTRRAVGL